MRESTALRLFQPSISSRRRAQILCIQCVLNIRVVNRRKQRSLSDLSRIGGLTLGQKLVGRFDDIDDVVLSKDK
jgi:hypothetical protein